MQALVVTFEEDCGGGGGEINAILNCPVRELI